jgi:hypothetical protein
VCSGCVWLSVVAVCSCMSVCGGCGVAVCGGVWWMCVVAVCG